MKKFQKIYKQIQKSKLLKAQIIVILTSLVLGTFYIWMEWEKRNNSKL